MASTSSSRPANHARLRRGPITWAGSIVMDEISCWTSSSYTRKKERKKKTHYAGHSHQAMLESLPGSRLRGIRFGRSIRGGTHVLVGCGDGVANRKLERYLLRRSRNHKDRPTLCRGVRVSYVLSLSH